MLTGLIEPTSGHILFHGQDVRARSESVPAPDGLCAGGAAPISASERARVSATGRPAARACRAVCSSLRWTNCSACSDSGKTGYSPLASYSKGMRQKILLLAALLHDPELLILDEPFSGLDVNAAMILRSLLHRWPSGAR